MVRPAQHLHRDDAGLENRPDTVVLDEPFYAHYLARLDGSRGDHPGREDVLAAQPAEADAVVTGSSRRSRTAWRSSTSST